jgi:hypothetical protein
VPQHHKVYKQQFYSKHCAKWEKTEAIPLKVKNETRVSTISTLIQYSDGIPNQSNKARERNKRDTKVVELSLCADAMTT